MPKELWEKLLQVARCAQADLEGIMPEFDPSGDREHPAWQTIEELKSVITDATLEAVFAEGDSLRRGKEMNNKVQEEIETLQIWDIEEAGETADRYTVIWSDGSYIGMSGAPFHPQGFCQHGEGAHYDPECELRGNELYSRLGKMISFGDLPRDCQEAVMRDILGSSPPNP